LYVIFRVQQKPGSVASSLKRDRFYGGMVLTPMTNDRTKESFMLWPNPPSPQSVFQLQGRAMPDPPERAASP
jgi:hypothetical protein